MLKIKETPFLKTRTPPPPSKKRLRRSIAGQSGKKYTLGIPPCKKAGYAPEVITLDVMSGGFEVGSNGRGIVIFSEGL